MSYKINRPCVEESCPSSAVDRGYCKKHAPPTFFSGGVRAQELPKDWNQRRVYVLKRDKNVCYVCGGKGADGVDHVERGNDHSFDNLKAIHHNTPPYCHRVKTSAEGVEAKKELKRKFEEEKRKRKRFL